jgi:hypothetical protein
MLATLLVVTIVTCLTSTPQNLTKKLSLTCLFPFFFVPFDKRLETTCCYRISLFHRAFQFTIYNGPTNALVCNKTLIQMSHTETLKITPTCFDHQMIIIRELFDRG